VRAEGGSGAMLDATLDPDLADLVKLWPKLPPDVRADVLAVVRRWVEGGAR
jgi:hypothetical protein